MGRLGSERGEHGPGRPGSYLPGGAWGEHGVRPGGASRSVRGEPGVRPRVCGFFKGSLGSAGGSLGPGRPGSYLPGLPQIRTCPSKRHPVRHVADSLSLTRPRSFRGDTLVRLGVLGVVPTPCPRRGAPFAPRGPEGPFPRFKATMRHCDSLPPISPHFVSFAWRYHRCVPFVRPRQPRTRDCGSTWVGKPVSPAGCYDGDDWVSQVPGEPF